MHSSGEAAASWVGETCFPFEDLFAGRNFSMVKNAYYTLSTTLFYVFFKIVCVNKYVCTIFNVFCSTPLQLSKFKSVPAFCISSWYYYEFLCTSVLLLSVYFFYYFRVAYKPV